jgi:hypothetical protein
LCAQISLNPIIMVVHKLMTALIYGATEAVAT